VTIAFGVACDDGVILVTDSLTQHRRLNGWIDVDLEGRKVGELGRMRYVQSGARPQGYEPDPNFAELPLEEAARAFFDELLFLEERQPALADGLHRPSTLLIADDSGAVLLSTWSETGRLAKPRQVRAEVGGAPLVGGAMQDWAAHAGVGFGLAPTTVADAVPFALASCRRYIVESWAEAGCSRYEDFHAGKPGGRVPPSAPPFHVAVITSAKTDALAVSK
jgi:hypothetical protein